MLTGRAEIVSFQQNSDDPFIKSLDWATIKTKVVNEKVKLAKRIHRNH
jgi:hypothetical protein